MKKFIIVLLVSLCLIAFNSCKTTKQVVTQFQKDTVYINHNSVQHDSVYVLRHDSVIVHQHGDTIFVDRFHTDFKDRFFIKTDTLYKYLGQKYHKDADTEKLIEKPLKWWQNILIWSGVISLLILIFLAVRFYYSTRK